MSCATPPEGAGIGEPDIVQQDDHDIRRSLRRFGGLRPVGTESLTSKAILPLNGGSGMRQNFRCEGRMRKGHDDQGCPCFANRVDHIFPRSSPSNTRATQPMNLAPVRPSITR